MITVNQEIFACRKCLQISRNHEIRRNSLISYTFSWALSFHQSRGFMKLRQNYAHTKMKCYDSVHQDRRFGGSLHCFWHLGPKMCSRYESYTLMPHIYRNKRFVQLVFVTNLRRTSCTESIHVYSVLFYTLWQNIKIATYLRWTNNFVIFCLQYCPSMFSSA